MTNVTLSLSVSEDSWPRGGLKLCMKCVKKFDMSASAYENISCVENEQGKFEIERGVKMEIYKTSKLKVCSELWPCLKEVIPNIQCSHVAVKGEVFEGCIFDWNRSSNCPFKLSMLSRDAKSSV